MSWSGGIFSRSNGTHTGSTVWAQDAAAGTGITTTPHDTHDQDLATGINATLCKDGSNTPTANLSMGGFKHTGVVAATGSGQYMEYAQVVAGYQPLNSVLTEVAAVVTNSGNNFTFPANVTASGNLAVTGTSTHTAQATFSNGALIAEISTPSAPASGNVLLYGKSGDVLVFQAPGGVEKILGKDPTVQKFTSGSGTATPSTGVVRWRVRMLGAGGAGYSNGSGNGGTTSLASWTAVGGSAGSGGSIVNAGGAGGTGGTNGTGTLVVRMDGQAGGSGFQFNPTGGSLSFNGPGGSSALGGGAAINGAINTTTSGTTAKTNSGSGNAGSTAGGGGGSGEYVEFYVSSPSAVSYAVGAAGGAAGLIIIDEFYS